MVVSDIFEGLNNMTAKDDEVKQNIRNYALGFAFGYSARNAQHIYNKKEKGKTDIRLIATTIV